MSTIEQDSQKNTQEVQESQVASRDRRKREDQPWQQRKKHTRYDRLILEMISGGKPKSRRIY